MKRHEVALRIQGSLASLGEIARSLTDAADEAAGEGVGAEQDSAVRLIVYRLAKLCKVDEISYGYHAVTLIDTYHALMDECKKRVKDSDASATRSEILRAPADNPF